MILELRAIYRLWFQFFLYRRMSYCFQLIGPSLKGSSCFTCSFSENSYPFVKIELTNHMLLIKLLQEDEI